jgi:hypothetical protein
MDVGSVSTSNATSTAIEGLKKATSTIDNAAQNIAGGFRRQWRRYRRRLVERQQCGLAARLPAQHPGLTFPFSPLSLPL